MKIVLSTLRGFKDDLFTLRISPPAEKTRSLGALVAGIDKTLLAKNDSHGICLLIVFQNPRTSPFFTDDGLNAEKKELHSRSIAVKLSDWPSSECFAARETM